MSLKATTSFTYERDAAIRAPWDNAFEAFEALLEHVKANVDLFLLMSNVVMLKLQDSTNLMCLFEQTEQCCRMMVKMHLEETPEISCVL
ncbi:unnamed protein product [Prunus armeniaca]|uniref:Uncharacterized protein n=1 Tax=Prunus armeniaca TaxID=36596 RepID=A0A6J5XUJ7_PRUAR|nr:unnamed protein product [Prunus armeniaca]